MYHTPDLLGVYDQNSLKGILIGEAITGLDLTEEAMVLKSLFRIAVIAGLVNEV